MSTTQNQTVTAGKHFTAVITKVIAEREAKGERRVDLIGALQKATGMSAKGVQTLVSDTVLENLPGEYVSKIATALNIEEKVLAEAGRLDAGEPEGQESETQPAPSAEPPTPADSPPAQPDTVMHSQEAVDGFVAKARAAERERISKIYEMAAKGGLMDAFMQCAFTQPVSVEQAGVVFYEQSLKQKSQARTEFSQEFIEPLDVPAPTGEGGELPSAEQPNAEAASLAAWVNNSRKLGAKSTSERVP